MKKITRSTVWKSCCLMILISSTGFTVPDKPEDICPVLIGTKLPEIALKTADGSAFNLNAAIAKQPTVLIFFRGGWCPYCNMHLGQLKTIEGALVNLGFQLIAVSPDRPEILNKPAKEEGLKYRLLSDNDMTASRALGIAFTLDDKTVSMYKSKYDIDIEADSGRSHHQLPVPSAFIVDRDGVVQFSFVNPNYKARISPTVLLSAAKAVAEQSTAATP